jgi:hypothetical protein
MDLNERIGWSSRSGKPGKLAIEVVCGYDMLAHIREFRRSTMSLAFLGSRLEITSTTSQSFSVQANPECWHIAIFHSVKLFKESALNYSEFAAST